MRTEWALDLINENNKQQKLRVIDKAYVAYRLGSQSAEIFLYNLYLTYHPFYYYGYHGKDCEVLPTTKNLTNQENPWEELWALLEAARTHTISDLIAMRKIKEFSERFDSDEWNLLARKIFCKDLAVGLTAKDISQVLDGTEFEIPTFRVARPRRIYRTRDLESFTHGVVIQPEYQGPRIISILAHDDVKMFNTKGTPIIKYQNILYALERIYSRMGHFGVVFDGVIEKGVYYIFDLIDYSAFVSYNDTTKLSNRLNKLELYKDIISQEKNVRIASRRSYSSPSTPPSKAIFRAQFQPNQLNRIIVKDLSSAYFDKNAWLTVNLNSIV